MSQTKTWKKWLLISSLALVVLMGLALVTLTSMAQEPPDYELFLNGRSLDGRNNNLANPEFGAAGQPYSRIAAPVYADDLSEMISGPDPRFISNRIYNDQAQNIFSTNGISHWGFVWGQFLDHSIGLREIGGETMTFPFNADDPLEAFTNDLGHLSFERTAAAQGTGADSVREQNNTISSFIDAFAVYSGSAERLDWLRVGSLDGDPTNNQAELLMTVDGYLPSATARGDATTAPQMELPGALMFTPDQAIIAGDMRANENLGLTAVQTIFAREHNRIVAELPDDLPEEVKFAIARRVVAATQQFITYEEFLPAFGVELEPYTGYDATVDPTLSNEFATVGYRAHSLIHGEFEMASNAANYSEKELAAFEELGIEVTIEGDTAEFAIPLNIAFGRPYLLPELGLDTVLLGLSSEAQYANDEQIDNQLRSVLFQIPAPDSADPAACLDGELLPDCYLIVNDLGVLDLLRGYDHGIPNYNDLRVAYGLEPAKSFTDITGEETAEFPDDPQIDATDPINDPNILDFVTFFDVNGDELSLAEIDNGALPTHAIRRTTVAARLAAIYGSVDAIDAFTGMQAEAHVPGTEFGELQLAMWTQQFSALRDGDRFFYDNDPVLESIQDFYGIDYRQTLADVIANNSDLSPTEVPTNVFLIQADGVPLEETETNTAESPGNEAPPAQEFTAPTNPNLTPNPGLNQPPPQRDRSDRGGNGPRQEPRNNFLNSLHNFLSFFD